jgi:anti-anti-sigma regulatory factor/Na+-transporting methylmalonyl-CoA/oxaloacetate decarboxylase gamma subunit
MNWLTRLITIQHPDPHMRRRGRSLAIIVLTMIGLSFLLTPLVFVGGMQLSGVLSVGVSLLVYGLALFLAHRGQVTVGGWIAAMCVTIGVTGSTFTDAPIVPALTYSGMVFLALSVLIVSLVMPAARIWWALLINLAALTAAVAFNRHTQLTDPGVAVVVVLSVILIVGVACLGYLGTRVAEQALRTAEVNGQQAIEALAHAETQARMLEVQAAALAEAEQRQRELVATLETPTVAVGDGVLLAPIIGTIDSARAQQITSRLLGDIAAQRVNLLIIDIAGVTLVDTAVAKALIETIQAVRLLGCAVVLTGITASVATTLTHLGIALEGVQTLRSPQDVLMTLASASQSRKSVAN